MSDHDALMAMVLENPDDDAPRLVFADWLDEHDGYFDCDKCRDNPVPTVVEVSGNGEPEYLYHTRCHVCNGTGRVPNGFADRGEFIRVQIKIAELEAKRLDLFNDDTDWSKCTGISAGWCPNCGDCTCREPEFSRNDADCPIHSPTSPHCCLDALMRKLTDLRYREQELHGPIQPGHWSGFPEELCDHHISHWVFIRGFVQHIELTAQDCAKHLDSLLKLQPIEEVMLTTWPEFNHRIRATGHEYCLVGRSNWHVGSSFTSIVLPDGRPIISQGLVRVEWPKIKSWTLPAAGRDENSVTHWFAMGRNGERYGIMRSSEPMPGHFYLARTDSGETCHVRIDVDGSGHADRVRLMDGQWVDDQQQP